MFDNIALYSIFRAELRKKMHFGDLAHWEPLNFETIVFIHFIVYRDCYL